jgi:hypothetical protein
MKELILMNVFLISSLLCYFTFQKIAKLDVNKQTKLVYTYLTLVVPLLGFFLVSRHTK